MFTTAWTGFSAVLWEGTPEDVAGAAIAAFIGLVLLASPGLAIILLARARATKRVEREAEQRRNEAEKERKRAARERLKREQQEERRREEARRPQAERERTKREQEERRREQARQSKGSRESSRGGGGSRRGGGDQRSTGDRGRDRRSSARPRTRTAHEVLGIAPEASDGEIVASYRAKVRMYHPDKVSGLAPEYLEIAEREMKEINAAYAKLKPKRQT